MVAVFSVSYGTYGEHYVHVEVIAVQNFYCFFQVACALIHRQFTFFKKFLWTFPAVIHNLPRFFQYIYTVCSKRNKTRVYPFLFSIGSFRQISLHRMQHARGIIHRAIGIHHHRETLLLETPADIVGKATANKKNALTWSDFPCRTINSHLCPKFHATKLVQIEYNTK